MEVSLKTKSNIKETKGLKTDIVIQFPVTINIVPSYNIHLVNTFFEFNFHVMILNNAKLSLPTPTEKSIK